jgi:hypothetical protein
MMRKIQNLFDKYPDPLALLLFLAVALVAWWQVAFLQYSVKWDMLDCYLPWRYFVGECWQNGIIPFWNPYQHFGYPIHADLRSAWYPEMFLIGLAGGYSNITLHFLTIFYLALAGLGMFKLIGFISKRKKVGLVTGMAYLLSGFFVGHGQDIGYIIGGAFVPWVLFYYLRLCKDLKWLDSLKAALFLLIMVMGAYPAFTILLNYILLFFFIITLFGLIKKKTKKQAARLVGLNAILYFLVVGSSMVLILTYPQVASYTHRLNGVVYDNFITNPFSPQSLLSWLVPFATVSNYSLFQSDPSMINGYWGILMMAFAAFGFSKKNKTGFVFFIIALVSLFLSFGPYTPVHQLLFNFLPGISLFRMPATFILFTIVGMLNIAGLGLKHLHENFDLKIATLKKVLLLFIALLCISLAIGLIFFPYHETVFHNGPDSIKGFFAEINFFEQLAVHSLLQLILLSLFYFSLKKEGKDKFLLKVGVFVFLEMGIAAQLNMNYTVVNHYDPMELRTEMKKLPAGFPTPDNRQIICHTEQASKMMPLWQNVNIFTKRPGYEGFNSFVLKQYENLFDKHPELAQAQLNNHLVFLSDQVFPLSKLEEKEKTSLTGHETFIADSLLLNINLSDLKSAKGDSAWVVSFTPNRIVINYKSQHPQLLTLMQANYTGWQAYLDDEKTDHFTSNILFRSLPVPAGQHQVIYRYENEILKKAFYFSYAILIFLLVVVIILHYKKLRRQNRVKAISFLAFVKLLIGIWVVLLIKNQMELGADQKSQKKLLNQAVELLSKQENAFGIFNVSNPENWEVGNPNIIFVSLLDRTDLNSIHKFLDTCRAEKIMYVRHNQKPLAETEELIRLKFPEVQFRKSLKNGVLSLFSKDGQDEREVLFRLIEHYEQSQNNNLPDTGITQSELSLPSGQSFVFSPQIVWGPGLIHRLEKDIPNKDLNIVVSCDAAIQEDCDVVLSMELFRGKQQMASEWIELQDFIFRKNRWQKVLLVYKPVSELQKGDEIKVHIWNRGKSKWLMDNLELMLISSDN